MTKIQMPTQVLILLAAIVLLTPAQCSAQQPALDIAAEKAAARELVKQTIFSNISPSIKSGVGNITSVYTFSKEIEVIVASETYTSLKQVDLVFKRRVDGAGKAFGRALRLREDGEFLGERAIIILPVDQGKKKEGDSLTESNVVYLVIWTWADENKVISAKSTSLRHALAYEIAENRLYLSR